MKIFAIKNKLDKTNKDYAYLFYYKEDKKFFIEINKDITRWDLPLLLDTFKDKKIYSINAYYSMLWVKQRIIPPNRQNIGAILKDNKLKEYDEYQFLIKTNGQCCQDNFYIKEIKYEDLPISIKNLDKQKIEDIIPLENNNLLVFFRDGKVNKCDLNKILKGDDHFKAILNDKNLFNLVQIETDGRGINFNDLNVSNITLYKEGVNIALSIKDFKSFVTNRIVDSNESAKLLNCTRQNIEDLTKNNKLHPIKSSDKYRLYLRSDIDKRKWN